MQAGSAGAVNSVEIRRFRSAVWRHYRRLGRHGLPWRLTRDPYRILVSEIMLQQTQVSRVLKFYPRFIGAFPDFGALARAETRDVLRAWQGMGYNRRALALRRLAGIVAAEHRGRLPRGRAALEALPGVGPATAGAVRAFAFNEREIFIETNIRRAFMRWFFRGRRRVTDAEVRRYIGRALDPENPREWYWALMDYGAWRGGGGGRTEGGARGGANPNRRSAHYRKQPRFAGSARELRGKILKILLRTGRASVRALAKETGKSYKEIVRIAEGLAKDGFVSGTKKRTHIELSS